MTPRGALGKNTHQMNCVALSTPVNTKTGKNWFASIALFSVVRKEKDNHQLDGTVVITSAYDEHLQRI